MKGDLSGERGGDPLPRTPRRGPATESAPPPSPADPRSPPSDPSSTADPRAVPALSIAGAARGLGVATATLRSWERRYGLVPSLHTAGGHRRYASDDLARLQVMHRLVRAGVPPAEAARVAINSPIPGSPDASGPFAALLWGGRQEPSATQALPALAEPPGPADVGAGPAAGQVAGTGLIEAPASGAPVATAVSIDDHLDVLLADTLVPDAHDPDLADPEEPASGHSSSGGGRVLPLPRQAGATARGLARSAMALDDQSCERILTQSLNEHGTVPTWDHLVRPVMAAIGRRWQSTRSGVEVEHSFSGVVVAGLARQASLRVRLRNDTPVLLASVPEELHDLPLRALHAALAERRIRAHLLGARTPADALADAVRRLGPPVVVLWAQMPVTELPVLPTLRPAPALIVGGPGLDTLAESRVRAHSLSEAIDQVRAAIGL